MVTRRAMIKAGLAGMGGLAGGAAFASAAPSTAEAPAIAPPMPPTAAGPVFEIPRRPLGRSGIEVPIIASGGAMKEHTPEILELAWDRGVRYFDTALKYEDYTANGKAEENVGEFLRRHPERRKELFLVTKLVFQGKPLEYAFTQFEERLRKLNTDYVDLFFLHGLETTYGPQPNDALGWVKSAELKAWGEQMKAAGKLRLLGFSSHAQDRALLLKAAAEGGFLDAIMVSYSPFAPSTGDQASIEQGLEPAIDACVQAGIGMIAMKTMRGLSKLPARTPALDALGMTSRQAVLRTVWNDPRFSAICSEMADERQMLENLAAAQAVGAGGAAPPPEAVQELRAAALSCGVTFCPNCDGSCGRGMARAGGPELALSDVVRYLDYYERDGATWAREAYLQRFPEPLELHAEGLRAAGEQCHCRLDFATLVPRAEAIFRG